MNAFGEALNLVFMRRSDALVPIPLPMDLRLHSHEFLFQAYGSQDSECIPMSPYFPANGSQDCIPMSPYSKPMDLKTAFP